MPIIMLSRRGVEWTYIRRLRHKLEPDPRRPQYILTQAGVGYLFPALP